MAGDAWRRLIKTLQRKRVFQPEQLENGNLKRCLTAWDLTALGLGSTLGVGMYVLVGMVAVRITGPSILLSFLIAAVAALFAGLCYAELGCRVPRAGSVYIYTYVTIGEFAAFIIGWNMILESVFGTASVAKGMSIYIDSMANGSMSEWFTSVAPISSDYFSTYFDFFAFLIIIVFGALLAIGARQSFMVNNVFVVLNILVIAFIIIAGSFTANPSNWFIPASDVPPHAGDGGFFPFGVWGTLKGAALCFYGFVGFDVISDSGEEILEPRRRIPQAILTVLIIAFFVYAGVGTVVTMMVPYYLLDKLTATASAFSYVGWDWARWVVSIGAVFGILVSLFGSLFPLPRLLYAMARDGLSLSWFAKVSDKRKSPVIATLIPSCFVVILASLVELEQLILMTCVGTLLSYTIVAACVILLRYRSESKPQLGGGYIKQMIGYGDSRPTRVSSRIVLISLLLFTCVCVATALVVVYIEKPVIATSVLHGLAVVLIIIMMVQPQATEELVFKTPLVPIIPCLSIYVNVHLMILLNVQTWIRVIIWICIGIPVYFLCICCYKREKNLEDNIKTYSKTNLNGKSHINIVVEEPSPPSTINLSTHRDNETDNIEIDNDKLKQANIVTHALKINEIIIQQAITENNEEKEAKIIDLLDQVLQAEEDSYVEMISLKEQKEIDTETATVETTSIPHRKSLSELSDAGSDASMGNQVLSKYDVIVQVHREDLPKVSEEEEKDKETDDIENDEHEEVTPFNDIESNSQTDESGYSDTIERNALNDSTEYARDVPNIPPPPPFDESYFASPYFKKSYTISARPTRQKSEEEENKPRESITSNISQDDTNIVFGSDRQMSFMSKLNNIFQNKMSNEEGEEHRRRSNSTGDMIQASEFALNRERPAVFLDLKKELMAIHSTPYLRPLNTEDKQEPEHEEEDEAEDLSMSREDLKSKLENIFATGGPKLLKPRLMKSNPPTPEESYQTDTSSTESVAKLPKMEKNDTLKRQKDKFGAVLNSFRLSLNKDDEF